MYCFPNNKQERFVSIDRGFYESVPNSFVVPLTRKRTLENISKSFMKFTIHICETILIASLANLKGDRHQNVLGKYLRTPHKVVSSSPPQEEILGTSSAQVYLSVIFDAIK